MFKVNRQPIIIHGGNWILLDGLLHLSKERYKTNIKFHADMHFNMILCWGGGQWQHHLMARVVRGPS